MLEKPTNVAAAAIKPAASPKQALKQAPPTSLPPASAEKAAPAAYIEPATPHANKTSWLGGEEEGGDLNPKTPLSKTKSASLIIML